MMQRLHSRGVHYALLLSAAALLYLPNLGAPSLWDIDEGNNAEAAREMLESGNSVVPTFNYQLRVDKPALLYWFQIAAYQLFGVSEWSARLPSALAALVAVLATYELGRRLLGATAGLLAGIVLASSTAFAVAAHFANPDALLTACTVLTLLAFWDGMMRWGQPRFALMGAFMGLAVLDKGPVGLVLPMTVAGLFLLWSGRWRCLLDRRMLLGSLIFVGVAGPWYAWVAADTKFEFLHGFLLKHNLGRFTDSMEGHSGPIYYYALALPAGFLPWSIFLGPTLWHGLKSLAGPTTRGEQGGRRKRPIVTLSLLCLALLLLGVSLAVLPRIGGRWIGAALPAFLGMAAVAWCWWRGRRNGGGPLGEADAARFLGCWAGVYFVFFSLAATKLPNYILPLYPPLALLTAWFLDRWRRAVWQPSAWVMPASLVCLALVGVGMVLGLLLAPRFLEGSAPDLHGWAVVGVLPILAALAAGWCWWQGRRSALLAVVAVAAVAFVGLLGAASTAVEGHKAPRALAQAFQAAQTEQDIRVGCYRYFQPSLVFYCRREVSQFGTKAAVVDFLRYPVPVYLFVPASVWEKELQGQFPPGSYRLLDHRRDGYRNLDVVVVTNR